MNRKGFSTIELLISVVIVSIVAIAMFKTVLDLLDKVSIYQNRTRVTIINGNITNSIQKDLIQRKLYGINNCGCNCYDIVYQDLTTKRLFADVDGNKIQYGGIAEKFPDDYSIYDNVTLYITTFTMEEDKNDSIFKIMIPVIDKVTEVDDSINIIYQYDSRDIDNLEPFVEQSTGESCPS